MSRYPLPVGRLILPLLHVFLDHPSSVSQDAALLLDGIRPVLSVSGEDNIPTQTPFVLVMNHYDRPGLGAWWGPVLVLHTIAVHRTCEPRQVHMMMAREWWYPPGLGRMFKQPLTRWFFGHLSKTYGLVLLPPVVPGDTFRGEGTLAVRRALTLTRSNSPQLVGLAPEGRTGEQGSLCEPPKGAGLFILALTHDSIPCLPVGIFEDEDAALTVEFGKPFVLHADRRQSRADQDRHASCTVMVQVGKLLPERMWGVYHTQIKRELEEM